MLRPETGFPILGYHQIFDAASANKEKHAVQVEEFKKQVAHLANNGFCTPDISKILEPEKGPLREHWKPVIISFDDGHESHYQYAATILKRHGFMGTFFLTVDWVGKPGYLNWEQIIEMREMGMSIQSHTMTHAFLPDVDKADLHKELGESKAVLEKRLGKSVDFISIPSGFINKSVIDAAREEGYRGICTSVPGLNSPGHQEDPKVLNRLMVTRKTSFETFCRMVSCDMKFVGTLRLKYQMKAAIRKIVGNKLYYKLWSVFSKEV